MAHAPLYYATYKGPWPPQATVGANEVARTYSAGISVQIGQADADEIEAQEQFEFEVVPVPADIIGTAEDAHPNDIGEAVALNERLAAREET